MLIRYSTVGLDGSTREERNDRFDVPTPEWEVPTAGVHVWDWYWEISKGTTRLDNGIARPIPWSEFLAFAKSTGQIVTAFEYDILRDMDVAFCLATNEESQLTQDQLADLARADAERLRAK